MRHLFFIPLLLSAAGASAVAPDTTALQGDGWSAAFRNGVLVELRNTLSGDVCVTAGKAAPLTGARLARDKLAATEAAESLQAVTVGADGCDAQWRDGLRLKQTMAAERGELVLRQEAVAPSPPVVGVQWGVADVSRHVEVLVPGHSGLRFGSDAPDGTFRFEYPISWEAQCVLLQGKRGGFLIYSDDTAPQFKVFPNGGYHRPEAVKLAFADSDYVMFEKSTGKFGTHPGLAAGQHVNHNVIELKYVQCLRKLVKPIILTRSGYPKSQPEYELNRATASLGCAEMAAFGNGGGFLIRPDL
ncbi:MAG: hypothetical protein N2689_16050, partial [Verrucomicrobiae bacterium]|nr:hypothetical protein [Verrucomicrobiae bacterium]